ncbi:MAG: type II toxin-antitoxin system RelB/DinJ family antitoxin [Anaerovoracaceae bacterium]
MAKTAVINVRVEPSTKSEIEALFAQFGISVSDAINIFLKQSLMQGGIPFTVQVPRPNAETIAAIEETEEMMIQGTAKRFKSVDELFEDLEA